MNNKDKEKILHGLSSCGNDYGIPNICEVTECPYRENKAWCIHALAYDAGTLISELLKAQEEVDPVKPDDDMMIYCGNCGGTVGCEWLGPSGLNITHQNYCASCGRKVKWK